MHRRRRPCGPRPGNATSGGIATGTPPLPPAPLRGAVGLFLTACRGEDDGAERFARTGPMSLWTVVVLSCGVSVSGAWFALVSEFNEHPSIHPWGVPERGPRVFMKVLGDLFRPRSNACSGGLAQPGSLTRAGTTGSARGLTFPDTLKPTLKGSACCCEVRRYYVGGGAGPDSTISVHAPERRRARCRLGFSTTWPLSSRPCFALNDRIRSRL